MAAEPKVIDVEPEGEVAELLDEATNGPLVLTKNGMHFRLQPEEDIWAGYDPDAARQATLDAAGSWKDIDADAFHASIRERRRSGSRPSTCW